eukprot:g4376.t1
MSVKTKLGGNDAVEQQQQYPSFKAVKQIEKLYKTFGELPSVLSGNISIESEIVKIKIYQSQKDLVNDKVEKFYTEHLLLRHTDNGDNSNTSQMKMIASNTVPKPLNCLYETASPDGQSLVKLISLMGEDGKKKYFFDIYGNNKRLHRIALAEYHENVILKNPFHNGFTWAKHEVDGDQMLVYIAEKKDGSLASSKTSTTLSFFNSKNTGEENSDNAMYTKSSKYEFEDDYGEQLEGIRYPQPFILTFNNTNFEIHATTTNTNIAFGTPIFTPNNKSIICTGWSNIQLRRQGIIYYNTRPSKIYQIDINLNSTSKKSSEEIKCITQCEETDYSCCNPSFIQNRLIYLTTTKTQRHNSASRMMQMHYNADKNVFFSSTSTSKNILIDVQASAIPVPISTNGDLAISQSDKSNVPSSSTDGSFCGIYDRGTWPAKQLVLNDHVVAFSSSNHSCMDIYLYNINTRSTYQFEIPKFLRADKEEGYQCRVLASKNNLLLWTFAKRNMMERVFLSDVQSGDVVTTTKFSSPQARSKSKSSSTITLQTTMFENTLLENLIHSINSKVITLNKDDIYYQGILTFPSPSNHQLDDDIQLPLIVMPHGGPHSNILANQDTIVSFMNTLGYGVLSLNYRGSLGFGLDSESSLPGNIGRNDVVDCNDLVQHTLTKYDKIFDSNNVFVVGGSHGGFLTAHLISQYPNMYNAAVS